MLGLVGFLLSLLAGCILPWAAAVVDGVDATLENALGAYPLHPAEAWGPQWDPEDIADLSEDVPLILTFGLMVAEMKIWMLCLRLLVLALMFSLFFGFLMEGLGDMPKILILEMMLPASFPLFLVV